MMMGRASVILPLFGKMPKFGEGELENCQNKLLHSPKNLDNREYKVKDQAHKCFL